MKVGRINSIPRSFQVIVNLFCTMKIAMKAIESTGGTENRSGIVYPFKLRWEPIRIVSGAFGVFFGALLLKTPSMFFRLILTFPIQPHYLKGRQN